MLVFSRFSQFIPRKIWPHVEVPDRVPTNPPANGQKVSDIYSFPFFLETSMAQSTPLDESSAYDEHPRTETQPLIERGQLYPSPLPKVQLGVLCFLRMLDPMSYTQIFPYINQFMSDLGVAKDPSQIGFYSGLVATIYSHPSSLQGW